MEKIRYPVVNLKGDNVGEVALDPRVFGQPTRSDLVQDVVVWQRNKARAGTHDCINKGAMKGGSRKPHKQKGSGRARAGGSDSPLWVGGGVAHGPHPRSYETRVPKRRRREGLSSVLSDKVRDKALVVVDSFAGFKPKTAELSSTLLKICAGSTSALVSVVEGKDAVARAAQNLQKARFIGVEGVNAFDILRKNFVVLSKDAVAELEKRICGEEA